MLDSRPSATASVPVKTAPIQILLRSQRDGGAWDPATLESVYRLVKRVQDDSRVERVESLVDLANAAVPNISEAQFKTITQQQVQADPRGAGYLPSLVNVNGQADTHSIVVISKEDELGSGTHCPGQGAPRHHNPVRSGAAHRHLEGSLHRR